MRLNLFTSSARHLQEMLDNKAIVKIYDQQARNGDYNTKINYNQRVAEIKKLLPALKPGSRVLDIACGTGVAIEALSHVPGVRVVGIDSSSEMLKIARNRSKHNRLVRLVYGDFMEVIFDNNSFDFIIMSHATRYIPVGREREFASKITAWLKPKGIFLAILHRSCFDKILNLLCRLLDSRVSINIPMTLEKSFIKSISPFIHYQKSVMVGNKNLLIKFVAVYFAKF